MYEDVCSNKETPPPDKKNDNKKGGTEKPPKRTLKFPKTEKLPSRPMKFPYTFSAKIAQFPFKFYIQNQWVWRYYLIALGVSLPVFYKIHKMANSEENVAKWSERKAREANHEEE